MEALGFFVPSAFFVLPGPGRLGCQHKKGKKNDSIQDF